MPLYTKILLGVAIVLIADGSLSMLKIGTNQLEGRALISAYGLGWSLVGLGSALALIAAVSEYRRNPGKTKLFSSSPFTNATELPLPLSGEVILDADFSYISKTRRLLWLSVGMLASIAVFGVSQNMTAATGHAAAGARQLAYLNIIYAVYFVLALVILSQMRAFLERESRRRIGVNSMGILYDDGHGILQHYQWSLVAIDGYGSLLLGKKLVQLRNAIGTAFPLAPLKGYVLARIPPDNRVNSLRLFWLSISRGNRANQVILLMGCALLLLQLVVELDPRFTAWLREYLRSWLRTVT